LSITTHPLANADAPPALTTPQQPPRPTTATTTPPSSSTPTTPPNPAEERFFEVGDTLPGWRHMFILNHPPTILSNKTHFRHVVKKTEAPTKEGLRWLKPMCDELKLPQSGNKTILIERLVGYFFMNVDEFEECFKGTFDNLLAKWGKAQKKMRDEEAHALSL
jgi:hypothetical protein